ncbi:MAG: ATP-binding protein [Vicinamibacterales bacterium]
MTFSLRSRSAEQRSGAKGARQGFTRYAIAGIATAIIVPLARFLAPVTGLSEGALAPSPLILPVIFSSWFGGRGPGLFSVACAASAYALLDIAPGTVPRASVFAVVAIIVVYLTDTLWTMRTRAEELHRQAARELAARQRVERALEGHEKQLDLIANAVPVLIAHVDADRRLTFVNRAWVEWFGAGAKAGTLESALPAATARALAIHAGNALEGRQTDFELTLKRESGTLREVEGVFVPDLDTHGAVRGFVAMLSDVTDRKRVQAGLALQNRLAQFIADARSLEQLPRLMEVVATGLLAESARLWMPEQDSLRLEAAWPPGAAADTPAPGSFVTKAWRDRAIHTESRDPERATGAVPISAGDDLLGVIEVTEARRFSLDGILRDVLAALGVQIGQFIQRAGAEADAEARARFNRRLVEAIPQIVWTAGADGAIDSLSARWHDATGLGTADSLGFAWQAAVHPDDLPKVRDAWRAAVEHVEPLRLEARLRFADGRWHWHLVVAIPSRDDVATQWFGTFTDIEDQKRAAESQRILAQVGTTLSAALGHEDTTRLVAELPIGRFADFAAVAELGDEGLRWVAVAHADARASNDGRRMRDMPDFRESATVAAARVARTGRPELAETPEATEADETLRGLGAQSSITVPLVARGRTLGAITLAGLQGRPYDRTDLGLAIDYARRSAVALDNARLYWQTEQASRMKDEFLATVSHELRTPLNAMLGWTKLLRSGRLDADRMASALETIERNTLAQAQLIEDLLDVSRIVTGKLRLQKRPVDLTEIVRAALTTVQPVADSRGVSLDLQLDMPQGAVVGDPARLQQVVWNLLSNAIKFSPEQGRVVVTLTSDAGQASLSVSDRGIGIPPAFLPYVFDRFRQADSTITRTHGGLGVGLAIVRHVVEMHGGSVEAFSEGENRGATFTVRLPLDTAAAMQAAEAVRAADRHAGDIARLSVVLVDDQLDALEMTRLLLETRGASVRTAPSARHALQALRDARPDVLVADIGMPGEDGYWLVEQVRRDPALADLPAIALTAYARAEDRARSLEAGYQIHLTKPLDADELTAALAALAK